MNAHANIADCIVSVSRLLLLILSDAFWLRRDIADLYAATNTCAFAHQKKSICFLVVLSISLFLINDVVYLCV